MYVRECVSFCLVYFISVSVPFSRRQWFVCSINCVRVVSDCRYEYDSNCKQHVKKEHLLTILIRTQSSSLYFTFWFFLLLLILFFRSMTHPSLFSTWMNHWRQWNFYFSHFVSSSLHTWSGPSQKVCTCCMLFCIFWRVWFSCHRACKIFKFFVYNNKSLGERARKWTNGRANERGECVHISPSSAKMKWLQVLGRMKLRLNHEISKCMWWWWTNNDKSKCTEPILSTLLSCDSFVLAFLFFSLYSFDYYWMYTLLYSGLYIKAHIHVCTVCVCEYAREWKRANWSQALDVEVSTSKHSSILQH